MKLLALDTAGQTCSAALLLDGHVTLRAVAPTREHARLILPMVDMLLADAGVVLAGLDAIAFGRGPGAFTGVRLAASVTQGLAFAAGLPVLPVSNLRAAAVALRRSASTGGISLDAVLVCEDARMREVYWALFEYAPSAVEDLRLVGSEHVGPPSGVTLDGWQAQGRAFGAAGTGLGVYADELGPIVEQARLSSAGGSPLASEVAALGAVDFAAGLQQPPEQALPVYLRDDVARIPVS